MRRLPPLVLLLLACAALAACGGGSGSSDDGVVKVDASTLANVDGKVIPSNTGRLATIVMSDNSFQAPLTVVRPGTRILFVNEDGVEHQVKSTSGEQISSPRIGKGEGWSFTPTGKSGAIDYVCTIHPNMKCRIQIGG